MLEVPALAWQLDQLLPLVDFLSIGSNDLMQFLFASDRSSPRLSDRYDPLSPAALRLLADVALRAGRAGVPVAYGSDLLGQLQVDQAREFLLRSQVLKPIEIIRQATTVAAQVIRQEGKLGCLKPGAFADLIVIDGDPLKDLGLFQEQGRHLSLIMKGGKLQKNRLQ